MINDEKKQTWFEEFLFLVKMFGLFDAKIKISMKVTNNETSSDLR